MQGALGARGGGGGEGHDWIGRRRLMMLRAVVVRGEEGGGGSDGAGRRRLMREGCGAEGFEQILANRMVLCTHRYRRFWSLAGAGTWL